MWPPPSLGLTCRCSRPQRGLWLIFFSCFVPLFPSPFFLETLVNESPSHASWPPDCFRLTHPKTTSLSPSFTSVSSVSTPSRASSSGPVVPCPLLPARRRAQLLCTQAPKASTGCSRRVSSAQVQTAKAGLPARVREGVLQVQFGLSACLSWSRN